MKLLSIFYNTRNNSRSFHGIFRFSEKKVIMVIKFIYCIEQILDYFMVFLGSQKKVLWQLILIIVTYDLMASETFILGMAA